MGPIQWGSNKQIEYYYLKHSDQNLKTERIALYLVSRCHFSLSLGLLANAIPQYPQRGATKT
jgi:hypothetical protein